MNNGHSKIVRGQYPKWPFIGVDTLAEAGRGGNILLSYGSSINYRRCIPVTVSWELTTDRTVTITMECRSQGCRSKLKNNVSAFLRMLSTFGNKRWNTVEMSVRSWGSKPKSNIFLLLISDTWILSSVHASRAVSRFTVNYCPRASGLANDVSFMNQYIVQHKSYLRFHIELTASHTSLTGWDSCHILTVWFVGHFWLHSLQKKQKRKM